MDAIALDDQVAAGLHRDAAWWESLPEDFASTSVVHDLAGADRLRAGVTTMMDWGASSVFGAAIGLAALSGSATPGKFRLERPLLQHYMDLADRHDAASAFPTPQTPRMHSKPKRSRLTPRLPGSEVLSLWFKSEFQPMHPRLRQRYGRHRNNQIAYAQWWRHRDGPRPVLFALHGFTADPYWINSRWMALPWFFRKGYDVLLFTLPFHGYRRERSDLIRGFRYLGHGVAHSNETIAHSVHDIRACMHYLFDQGVPQIGITGPSLGGYTSALMAAVEPRLSFSIPNVPLASPADLFFEWLPTRLLAGRVLDLCGTSLTELRHMMAVHSPLTYRPALPRDRLLVIAGAGDRFAPPRHAALLAEHWQSPLHWFPGNHLLHLDQGRYLRKMLAFMDRCVQNPDGVT